jgi:hypothetical protein
VIVYVAHELTDDDRVLIGDGTLADEAACHKFCKEAVFGELDALDGLDGDDERDDEEGSDGTDG